MNGIFTIGNIQVQCVVVFSTIFQSGMKRSVSLGAWNIFLDTRRYSNSLCNIIDGASIMIMRKKRPVSYKLCKIIRIWNISIVQIPRRKVLKLINFNYFILILRIFIYSYQCSLFRRKFVNATETRSYQHTQKMKIHENVLKLIEHNEFWYPSITINVQSFSSVFRKIFARVYTVIQSRSPAFTHIGTPLHTARDWRLNSPSSR